MAATWAPNEQGVHQICSLLTEFQKPGTNQAQILAQLDQCKQFPDFNNYLAFIFAQGEGLPVEVRQSAGLLLKNNIKAQYGSLSEEYRAFIKAALLRVLGHASRPLRHTAGTCVVAIAGLAGVATWPQLVAAMAEGLDSGDPAAVEGILDTLYKICEEHPLQLEARVEGLGGQQRPNDVLVPRVLAALGSPSEDIRALAVGVANLLTNIMPAALMDNMDRFLTGLFALAHDPSPAVRKAVCTGLVALLMAMPERLQPSMTDLIEYMLQSTQDGDEGVAVESCEFWSAFCESQIESEVLRPFLPRLLPVLLKNMVWEEFDEEVQQAEALEAEALAGHAQQDRDDEIKPFIHRSQAHGGGGGGGEGGGAGGEAGEVGGEEEEEDDDEEEVSQWNLRRCSAAGLDMLSTVFGDELLPIILPIVQQRLQGSDWRARESAILALGAVSQGCATGLTPFLPEMVAMLLPTLADPRPLVRCISCWALGRYSKWILERAEAGQRGELDAVVQGICGRCLDHNRRVQDAACSALCTLLEEGGERLTPYLPVILQTIAAALQRYGKKNMRLVYDAASTVAEHTGRALAESPALAQLLLPPLFGRLGVLPDGDRELLPVMECLAAVCQAAGSTKVYLTGPVGEPGTADAELAGPVRMKETNLGNLYMDALVWYLRNQTNLLSRPELAALPVVATIGGGNIRASVPPGTITQGAIQDVAPFGDWLVAKRVSSTGVLAALRHGLSGWSATGPGGNFPQVSGLRFAFDSGAPDGSRLLAAFLPDGRRLGAEYSGDLIVGTNSFQGLPPGGDGYDMLQEAPLLLDTARPMDHVLADFIAAHSPVSPRVEGRIVDCGATPHGAACAGLVAGPVNALSGGRASWHLLAQTLAGLFALAVPLAGATYCVQKLGQPGLGRSARGQGWRRLEGPQPFWGRAAPPEPATAV